MYKIIGFVGPSGCGKDTAARYLANKYPDKYHYVKLCTTRPQRNEEDNGYIFLDSEKFLKQVLNGKMLNAQEFRGWYYGLNDEGLVEDKVNLLPMSNEMVMQMKQEDRTDYDLIIYYIVTRGKERLLHILKREEKPDCIEVCRRFLSDVDDYQKNQELWSYCYRVIENNYDANFLLSLEMTIMNDLENDKDKMD